MQMSPRSERPARRRPTVPAVAAACAVTAAAAVLAQAPPAPARDAAVAAVMTLANEIISEALVRNPLRAAAQGVPNARHGELPDNSLPALAAWEARQDRWLAELEKIDPGLLNGTPARVVYGVLRERLEAERDDRACQEDLWRVNHMTGWQTQLPGTFSAQPLGTPELRTLALSRFRQVPRFLDIEIEKLREGLRRDYRATKLTVALTIEQIDRLLAEAPDGSPLFAPARQDPDPEFTRQWNVLISDSIRPAIERYRNFLANEYLAAARDDIAVVSNPNGAACYRAKVRLFTTLDIDPSELFTAQMQKLEQAEAAMRQLSQRRYQSRDIREVLRELYARPSSSFRTREDAIAAAEGVIRRAESHLPALFTQLPSRPLVVEPVPAFLEATAPPGYRGGSRDGSRPARFLLNVRQAMEPGGRLSIEQLAFHEGAPGHHLQATLTRAAALHPAVVFWPMAAFGEGWAVYAEQLAFEHGMYSSDEAGLVALNRISQRFAGNVAEIGVHIKGWSRQKALEFRLQYSELDPKEEARLLDRRIAWLGQGHAYGVGASEILSLREEARQALGPKFDLREFHVRVLEDGPVPLQMLRSKIERWIQASR